MNRLSEAVAFAAKMHDGMLRKGKNIPYIVHPMEVAAIAAALTEDEDVLCAAVLHDVMEDCGVSAEELDLRFGARVAQLVQSETQLCDGDCCASWEKRKRCALTHIAQGDRAVKIIALSDKLSNMRAIRRDFDQNGDALFDRFHQRDIRMHAWYYRSCRDLLAVELGETDEWRELRGHIAYVFGEEEDSAEREEDAV